MEEVMSSDRTATGVPTRWRHVRPRDCGWLLCYGWRAIRELVKARRRFGDLNVADLHKRNLDLEQAGAGSETPDTLTPRALTPDLLTVDRIAFIVPRMAPLMPFRSDCLIQATGAQAWLTHKGIASRIVIGVERPDDKPFGAHAWLEHDGKVITGGDVSQYTVLL